MIGNYRRFASKYGGDKPKLDPLVSKKVQRDSNGKSPSVGRNLMMKQISTYDNNEHNASLGSAHREYNGDDRKDSSHDGIFMRKSQSISGILPVLSS